MKEVYRFFVNGDIVFGKILRDKMLLKCDNYYKLRFFSSIILFIFFMDLV